MRTASLLVVGFLLSLIIGLAVRSAFLDLMGRLRERRARSLGVIPREVTTPVHIQPRRKPVAPSDPTPLPFERNMEL